jgi:hypothetical protein
MHTICKVVSLRRKRKSRHEYAGLLIEARTLTGAIAENQ